MKIDIIFPSKKYYHSVLKKTSQYFNYKNVYKKTLFDYKNQINIIINKQLIHVYVNDLSKTNQKRIQNYLEYVFKDNFIGMKSNQINLFKFDNIKVVEI